MIPLSRVQLKSITPGPVSEPRVDELLQESLGGCPWRVAIASMLLCRTTRRQAAPALRELLYRYPSAEALCRAEDVEDIVRPCGLQRNRARQLTRFSGLWLSDSWDYLRELPGVGLYVADAVGLVCLGCTELESTDHALVSLARRLNAGLEV